jgi:hypothetical protein
MQGETFIQPVTHAQIGASTALELDLNELRTTHGKDFNTLFITNTDTASSLSVYADGVKIAHVAANGGVFSFDWEFYLIYNFLTLENNNSGAAISANNVKVFVGRTGPKNNGVM